VKRTPDSTEKSRTKQGYEQSIGEFLCYQITRLDSTVINLLLFRCKAKFTDMKKLLMIFVFISVAFWSCEKDDEITDNTPVPVPPPANTIDEFTMFHAGNYWIYQTYIIDSNGNETLMPGEDSCYYTGDTIINTDTFHIVHNWWVLPGDRYLKDSSGYLIDGGVILTVTITNDTFYTWQSNDTTIGHPYASYMIVTSLTTPVTVPAGTFSDVLDVANSTYYNPSWYSIVNPLVLHTLYAKNIGKISEQYALSGELYSQHAIRERRLVRYHVN
jgi:hypothetical protein